MKIFLICVLILFLNGASSKFIKPDSSKIAENPYKLNFINSDFTKVVEFLMEQRIISLIKQMEIENQKRYEKEREEKIYRDQLASRVSSSVLRDFHTLRY